MFRENSQTTALSSFLRMQFICIIHFIFSFSIYSYSPLKIIWLFPPNSIYSSSQFTLTIFEPIRFVL